MNSNTQATQRQRLSRKQLEQCGRLIIQYKELLRIQDWDVQISQYKPVTKTHLFEISINRRRKHAAIRVSDKALSITRQEFELGMLHEHLHLVFDEMDYEINIGKHFAYARTFDRYVEARERTVDHLSKVLYTAIS